MGGGTGSTELGRLDKYAFEKFRTNKSSLDTYVSDLPDKSKEVFLDNLFYRVLYKIYKTLF